MRGEDIPSDERAHAERSSFFRPTPILRLENELCRITAQNLTPAKRSRRFRELHNNHLVGASIVTTSKTFTHLTRNSYARDRPRFSSVLIKAHPTDSLEESATPQVFQSLIFSPFNHPVGPCHAGIGKNGSSALIHKLSLSDHLIQYEVYSYEKLQAHTSIL
jgi:hypothetical protein